MAYFVVEYFRPSGTLVNLKEFTQAQYQQAIDECFTRERALLHDANSDTEVVLLEAGSKEELQRTHARYFSPLSKLAPPTRPANK